MSGSVKVLNGLKKKKKHQQKTWQEGDHYWRIYSEATHKMAMNGHFGLSSVWSTMQDLTLWSGNDNEKGEEAA